MTRTSRAKVVSRTKDKASKAASPVKSQARAVSKEASRAKANLGNNLASRVSPDRASRVSLANRVNRAKSRAANNRE
jgi:hypothetical protein